MTAQPSSTMTLIPRLIGSLSTLALLGCASAGTQRTYVAPTAETVFTTAEEMSASPGQIVSITNSSTVPIVVSSVTLRDCVNVNAQCSSPRRMNLQVEPGGHATLLRVEPANRRKALHYSYSYSWRADSAAVNALRALALAGDTVARQRLGAIERAEARRRGAAGVEDLDLSVPAINALGDQVASLRVSPDSLVLRVGGRITLDTVRVLLIGTQGETLGRVRSLQWRVTSSIMSVVRPDTLLARSPGGTFLELKLPDSVLPGQPTLHAPVQLPIIVHP